MKFICLSLLILISSCASQKTDNNSNEDYQVLNAYLEQIKDSIIFNTNTLVLDYKKPGSFFQSYLHLSKRFKRFRTKKEFFNKNQIEELKVKYPEWEVDVWNIKYIKKENIRYVDSITQKIFDYSGPDIKEYYNYPYAYTISKPFYDRKKKKAFLIINIYTENGGYHAKGLGLLKMQKVKGEWVYYGGSAFY